MTKQKKLEYIQKAHELAKKYNLKFYAADNNMGKIGCSGECCGTEVLHNYKIWGNNSRSSACGDCSKYSQELGKCNVNFVRSQTNKDKTMDEVARTYIDKQKNERKLVTKRLI
jgi:hypothetical protein